MYHNVDRINWLNTAPCLCLYYHLAIFVTEINRTSGLLNTCLRQCHYAWYVPWFLGGFLRYGGYLAITCSLFRFPIEALQLGTLA